ncbi:hypothetical protein MMC26_003947 [Xylographa opegraphella]|nr:hypothetical protein [Xylographa opegraphella]
MGSLATPRGTAASGKDGMSYVQQRLSFEDVGTGPKHKRGDVKGGKKVVKDLNSTTDVGGGFDEAEGSIDGDIRDNVVSREAQIKAQLLGTL